MPNIGHPLWLLAPLLALAALAIGRRQMQLPGGWRRAIQGDLQAFLATTVRQTRSTLYSVTLIVLWLLLGAALATITLGQIEMPKLRNLDARIVVIDLGLPELAADRVAAARYLIDNSDAVPTAVVAVTEHAFDVVPLTRDDNHIDRYLQVLTKDVMPVEGRSLAIGIERAVALLDRASIQARQITVFTGGLPPLVRRFQKPERTKDHNIWLVVSESAKPAWQDFAEDFDASLISDLETSAVHDDFEKRRQEAAAKSVSIRERQDITPWLIGMLLPLWLLFFCRRQPE